VHAQKKEVKERPGGGERERWERKNEERESMARNATKEAKKRVSDVASSQNSRNSDSLVEKKQPANCSN
jgi:hypothetical protein